MPREITTADITKAEAEERMRHHDRLPPEWRRLNQEFGDATGWRERHPDWTVQRAHREIKRAHEAVNDRLYGFDDDWF